MNRHTTKMRQLIQIAVALTIFFALLKTLSHIFSEQICKRYSPAAMVLNCFDKDVVGLTHLELSISPSGRELVTPGNWSTIHWFENWQDKTSTTHFATNMDFARDLGEVAYSGDERLVAIWADERSRPRSDLAIIDARTHELVRHWPVDGSSLHRLRLSPDGSLVVAGFFEGVRIYNTADGKEIAFLKNPDGFYFEDLAFPEGRLTLAYHPKDLSKTVFYASTDPYVAMNYISSVNRCGGTAFSNDGKLVAIGKSTAAPPSGSINVYRVSDAALIASLEKPEPFMFAFSSDGRLLASSHFDGDTVVVWDVKRGKELCTLAGFKAPPKTLVFGPGDQTLLTRDYYALVVWDISVW